MAQLNIRIDDDIKKRAEQACTELGLSISSAINIYLVKLGREHRIPFEVSADPFYSEANMAELKRRVESVRRGESVLTEHELIEDYDE